MHSNITRDIQSHPDDNAIKNLKHEMIYNSDTSAQVIGYQYDFIFHNLQLSLRDQPVAVGEIGVIIVAFNLLSKFPMFST